MHLRPDPEGIAADARDAIAATRTLQAAIRALLPKKALVGTE